MSIDQYLTTKAFVDLLDSRLKNLEKSECSRLFHGRGGLWKNAGHFNIEKYGRVIAAVFYAPDQQKDWLTSLNILVAGYQYDLAVQHRWQKQGPWYYSVPAQKDMSSESAPSLIQPQNKSGLLTETVIENGLKYRLIFDRQNPGLFLDMRAGRDWVRNNSQDCRIANLFAYTCGFAVTAAAGGANSTFNMDMSSAALDRGRQNLVCNDSAGDHEFFAHDITKSLGKITRSGPFDGMVIDPPTQQKSFRVESQYPRILKRCVDWISPGGWLLLTMNNPLVRNSDFIDLCQQHLGRYFRFECRLPNPEELQEQDSELGLKVLIFRRQ